MIHVEPHKFHVLESSNQAHSTVSPRSYRPGYIVEKREVKELLSDDNHLFISQFLPNLTWAASNAMKRNNTIVGVSDAMILIEAGMDGGTFNAGELSFKNKKQLFVVEYGVSKPTAEGNKFFLQHGGMPLRGDKNGNPILKRVYSYLQDNKIKENYEQLSLNLS